ncbi:MAG: diguanylate cyclase [Tissierellaceae bacterium]|nr:diguanylate cyclase [Tissierellaceae bacterium]
MYIATYIIDIAALLYLIGLLYSSTTLNFYRKRPFLIAIILTVIIILSEAGTVLTDNGILKFRSINILCNVLGFTLTPMIPIAIALIFDKMILRTHKLLLIPTLINMVATVLSPLFGFIFYVDSYNQYIRGDYFLIFIIVYIINFLFLVIITLEVGKNCNYPIMCKLVALSLFIILGTSIQLVYPLAYSSWHCVTLSLLLYYLLMSEFDSSFDTLTSLYNRATFDKATKQMVETKAFSIIILDIDDFKSINDTYGHDYGDTVIREVASIIRKSFNKHYTCYRLGGDEFAIIGNETDPDKIEYLLRTVTNNLSEMRQKGSPVPTVSYGYSVFPGGEKLDFSKTFKEADDQMYHYKKIHKLH